ncbi:transposable element Tc1 transposase [Trichonephila clavipes]|nr:transposable element Tc1 transposase [Trichonephila clavipes]
MAGKRAGRHFSQLSEFERGLIIGMKTAGLSTCRVAGQVDRSECAVRNCWEQWTRKGPTRGKPGLERPGRPRGERIEGSHLADANLKSKRPFRALSLTPEHLQLRLQWCQARSMCNVADWQTVVFSDESRFVLGTDDNRVWVWRRLGAIFQQDNARPHTARVAQDFLRHFQTLSWPVRSPNLSPVEHVWDQLKRQMPSCHSVHDLVLAVQDLWAHLLQDNIRCLINSMSDRFGLAIHQNDHRARRRFVELAQNEITVVPDFHKRILFSYEAHFWLNGYVNKQNCRIWSEANPQVYVETPLHPEKLTVWCALWAGGILLQKR